MEPMKSGLGSDGTQPLLNPQFALLDSFLPGFSILSSLIYRYLKVDITLYIPIVVTLGILAVFFPSTNEYIWSNIETYFMSSADIRVDDEMYNMVMSWVATQNFAKASRHFVASMNLNSRNWYLWQPDDDEENEEDDEADLDELNLSVGGNPRRKRKTLQVTPSFGNHYFWYKKRLMLFRRLQSQEKSYALASEREEISILSFGRNPSLLKELLDECRINFLKNDEKKTLIYRGIAKAGTLEPTWTRCMSRVSRPFSTVFLDEAVKKSLLEDISKYLNPFSQRYYNNRGIPWRRGYLLAGKPGTGKSSLSFAIAGHFRLKIYIVSLNSPAMTEEALGTLFVELPRRCVVLLEDIDTAGLTHTRDGSEETSLPSAESTVQPSTEQTAVGSTAIKGGISLSALLNVIDGVASQEGRILIMTTNHMEKLDKALIRPGRIDVTVNFELTTPSICTTIFKSIFTVLEEDFPPSMKHSNTDVGELRRLQNGKVPVHEKDKKECLQVPDGSSTRSGNYPSRPRTVLEKQAEDQQIAALAEEFAALIPGGEFSPAEVQGFLLKFQGSPEKAVAKAPEWVEKFRIERTGNERADLLDTGKCERLKN